MENSFQEKKVLDSMMKNRVIERSLGLEKRQSAVLAVMKKQGITEDPSKLKGFKREKFLKGIDKQIGVGFYAKKALHEVYGEKKEEPRKSFAETRKDELAAKRKRYDEIMGKNKSFSSTSPVAQSVMKQTGTKALDFRESNRGIREAADARLLASKNGGITGSVRQGEQNDFENKNDDIRSRLRGIQS